MKIRPARPRFPPSLLAPLAILLGALSLIFLGLPMPPASARESGSGKDAGDPKPAPSFSLPTRAGTPVVLDSLRGKVVLVDFWASWCEPCKKSFPWMTSMQTRFGAKGFDVVAVNLDKNPDQAIAFLDQFPVQFPIAFDSKGKTAEAFDVSVMPSSFLIDRRGRIVYTHRGFDPAMTAPMEAAIESACGKEAAQ